MAMHPGLAALAEEQASNVVLTRVKSFFTKVKTVVSNREAIRQATGKQLILARSFFNPTAFSKPENREVWLARVRANFAHYRSLCARHHATAFSLRLFFILTPPDGLCPRAQTASSS